MITLAEVVSEAVGIALYYSAIFNLCDAAIGLFGFNALSSHIHSNLCVWI